MDTLWHSMKLHRYFREPHGIPWNSTIFPGIPWTSKETPWNFMAFHGTPSLLHGTPWNSMDTPWKFRGIPWISMDFHGIPWISIDFHGFPWNSMEFHGGISHGIYTRVNSPNLPYPKVAVFQKLLRSRAKSSQNKTLYHNL